VLALVLGIGIVPVFAVVPIMLVSVFTVVRAGAVASVITVVVIDGYVRRMHGLGLVALARGFGSCSCPSFCACACSRVGVLGKLLMCGLVSVRVRVVVWFKQYKACGLPARRGTLPLMQYKACGLPASRGDLATSVRGVGRPLASPRIFFVGGWMFECLGQGSSTLGGDCGFGWAYPHGVCAHPRPPTTKGGLLSHR